MINPPAVYTGVWPNGKATAFDAVDTGSIPVTPAKNGTCAIIETITIDRWKTGRPKEGAFRQGVLHYRTKDACARSLGVL